MIAATGRAPGHHTMSHSSTLRFFYESYGLRIASDLPLPELRAAAAGAATTDVEILAQPLPEALDGATESGSWWQVAEGRYQFVAAGVARYRVEHGRRIIVDRYDPRATSESSADVRVYLLGTALGALLHQRGLLPLHVSALCAPSGTWAFTGPSGAGKSTLAAWLHRRFDWPMVSDDVAVLDAGTALPRLHPGPTRLKLWRDALAALGIDESGLARDATRYEKFHLVVQKGFEASPQGLTALVLLESEAGAAPELVRLKGQEAFRAIHASIYRPEFAVQFRRPDELFRQCVALANRIRVYRFRRPRDLAQFDATLEILVAQMRRAAASDELDQAFIE